MQGIEVWVWLFLIIIVILIIWEKLFPKVSKKPGQVGEENTVKLIKQFIKWKGWKENDYLLVSNLILQKENYWSCEIDILLLTRKWIYIIEVKDWGRGWLSGNYNHEYLEWSYKVGKKKQHRRHQMYSPFYQNEQHVKRFKSYFYLPSNQNILSIICFNSPYLIINLKETKKTAFENKHLWVINGQRKDISSLLDYCENQNTRLIAFEQLREKISKEILIIDPEKAGKHHSYVKSTKGRRKLEETSKW